MLMKSGCFLFLLAVLQVSARYNHVEPDFIDYEISQEPVAVLPSSSRIVSGWEALPGQNPHHASLRMVGANGGISVCGGSIVSEEWVLTSAFCTVNRILAVVRAGLVDLTNPEYVFETAEWYIHPKYNLNSSNLQAYNIALIKLQRPVVFTELLKPIQIQSTADAFRDYAGEQVYASGHGRTSTNGPESDVLRWVYLRAISNTACRRTYSSGIFDTTICALHYNVTSQNTCNGDLGGPLVHVGSDGVPTLIGVSYFFSARGCESGLPSGYIRPGAFLLWLEEVIGMNTSTTPNSNSTSPSTPTTTTTLRYTGSTSLATTSPIFTTTINSSPSTLTTTTTPRSTDTTSPTITSSISVTPTTPTYTNSTSNTPISTIPEASTPNSTDSEDFPSEETITEQPEEDKEVDETDSAESDEDDDIAQLLKRLLVSVKVKVRLNKYNVTRN
ncbi:hypothetical protein PYW07_008280 [Mythimna separata]|uniref:Peptidase S1 domain-containing protein n=1 Tax=Mythimna separata TaxID=271217 RepID=A0AAD7YCR7_MYTSE|nr:hypothetical protein PYW07_008280 [Mythimna separata]